eukprot:355471-Chlamydomonas_euryale.AAC.5
MPRLLPQSTPGDRLHAPLDSRMLLGARVMHGQAGSQRCAARRTCTSAVYANAGADAATAMRVENAQECTGMHACTWPAAHAAAAQVMQHNNTATQPRTGNTSAPSCGTAPGPRCPCRNSMQAAVKHRTTGVSPQPGHGLSTACNGEPLAAAVLTPCMWTAHAAGLARSPRAAGSPNLELDVKFR